jgi:hypothetical protein
MTKKSKKSDDALLRATVVAVARKERVIAAAIAAFDAKHKR